jgi:hypothetical protein
MKQRECLNAGKHDTVRSLSDRLFLKNPPRFDVFSKDPREQLIKPGYRIVETPQEAVFALGASTTRWSTYDAPLLYGNLSLLQWEHPKDAQMPLERRLWMSHHEEIAIMPMDEEATLTYLVSTPNQMKPHKESFQLPQGIWSYANARVPHMLNLAPGSRGLVALASEYGIARGVDRSAPVSRITYPEMINKTDEEIQHPTTYTMLVTGITHELNARLRNSGMRTSDFLRLSGLTRPLLLGMQQAGYNPSFRKLERLQELLGLRVTTELTFERETLCWQRRAPGAYLSCERVQITPQAHLMLQKESSLAVIVFDKPVVALPEPEPKYATAKFLSRESALQLDLSRLSQGAQFRVIPEPPETNVNIYLAKYQQPSGRDYGKINEA